MLSFNNCISITILDLSRRLSILQFFDDLPNDRWAAFLYVERHARERDLTEPSSPENRRRYIQWVLVAAHELKLLILPEWQSQSVMLYRAADQISDESFADFEQELAVVLPKISSLAKLDKAPRAPNENILDLSKAT